MISKSNRLLSLKSQNLDIMEKLNPWRIACSQTDVTSDPNIAKSFYLFSSTTKDFIATTPVFMGYNVGNSQQLGTDFEATSCASRGKNTIFPDQKADFATIHKEYIFLLTKLHFTITPPFKSSIDLYFPHVSNEKNLEKTGTFNPYHTSYIHYN